MDEESVIVLDEVDANRILRILYNGTRPARVHTLVCLCGAISDLRMNPKAWNGWQILPTAKCPACLKATKMQVLAEAFPQLAEARFAELLTHLKGRSS